MISRAMSTRLAGAAAVALLFGFGAGVAEAQQTPPKQKQQPAKQAAPKQAAPAAQLPVQPKAGIPLTPALLTQLNQDIRTCDAGQDLAALERACTNVLRQPASLTNFDPTTRGRFYYNRSRGRIDAGDIPGAIEDLRKAISDDYNPHLAYAQLGQLYLNRQADVVQAEASYRKALELDPGYRDAHIGLALTLLRKRDAGGKPDVSGAVREINAALELAPQDAELHYHKGLALAQGTSSDDALKSLDEALRLKPGYVDALIARVQLNMDRGQNKKALEDLNAIVASNPNDAGMLAGLGAAYTQLKQYDRAIELCERAVRQDVKNVTAHVCQGYALTNQGRFRKAEEAYESALQWGSSSLDAYIGRGYLRKRTGNFASAESDFAKALTIDPKSFDAHLHLISLYTDTGDLDKALRSFDEANNINRKDARAYYVRSFVWALKGDATRARRDVETAFGLVGSGDSDALLARGTMSYFLNDTTRALPDLREAIRLNPDNGQAHRVLARTLLKSGNLREAEASLRRAEQLLPSDWNVMRTWGLLEIAHNNFEKAKDYLDRSLELNGAFIEGYVALGRAYEGLRNPDLAKAQYQLALTKLDYDNDGPPAREEAKRRLAALGQAPATATATPPPAPAPKKDEPRVATAPPVERERPQPTPDGQRPPAGTRTAEGASSDSFMCRMFKSFAEHARDTTGVQINPGCGPR